MYELAVCYARFSSENQDIKSADDQEAEINEYANKNNIQVIKYFRDEAKSGTKTVGRNGFAEMIDFCRKFNRDKKNLTKISYVLVWKFNRFARNDYDSSYNKNKLKSVGIRVLSITQKIEDTPEGHLLEGFLQNIDAYFSENLAEDIKRGLRNNAKEFKFNGGTPPLGYKIENQKYVVEPSEARIIKMIFDMYLNGSSLIDIAIALNNLGYKTRFNQPFKPTSIFDILSNEKYIGVYEFRASGNIVREENAIPAIISIKDFERVKEMRNNNRKHRGSYSAKQDYLLSGLIFCKDCGRNYVGMTKTKKKGNNVYRYKRYGCNGRNKLYGCENVYVDAEPLENYAFELLKEKLTSKENLEEISVELEGFIQKFKKEVNYAYEDTKKELKEVQAEISRCVDAIAHGLYSEELKEHTNKLEERKKFLQEELLEEEHHKQKDINLNNFFKMITDQINQFPKFSVEDKKIFFKTYIKKIEIDHSNITFYFNLKSLGTKLAPDMEPLVQNLIRWRIPFELVFAD